MTLLSLEAGLDDNLVASFAVMFARLELPDGETEEVKTCATFVFIAEPILGLHLGAEPQKHVLRQRPADGDSEHKQ